MSSMKKCKQANKRKYNELQKIFLCQVSAQYTKESFMKLSAMSTETLKAFK